jgi:membrane-bound lytic murein transglycosylase D
MVKKELHLQQVAEVLDIDLEELKLLNPQYKRFVIPAFMQPYPLRLKNTDIIRFIEWEDSVYKYKYEDFFTPMKAYEGLFTGTPLNSSDYRKIYHTVRQGEGLVAIANKYGLSVVEIRKMINLSSNTVKAKQKLFVGYEYVKQSAPSQVEEPKQTPVVSQNKTSTNPEIYIVKKGDSLSSIAAKYGTTSRKIAEYNNLQNINALSIGQKLKIPQK